MNALMIIAGPCVVESRALCMEVADRMTSLAQTYHVPYVFKASYRKDNRSRVDSFTGLGDEVGLDILAQVKQAYHVPVITDIHVPQEASLAAQYGVDILQIPAFLCRQTSLLQAAAQSGCKVNVKKGQFLAPSQMKFVVDKLLHFGCRKENIWLTDRGTQFGYSDLLVDVRGIPEMKQNGVPVILDVTHALQQPNQREGVTGGRPDMIRTLAAAGVAAGVDGLFLETHPHPEQARSDGANMLPLSLMEDFLKYVTPFREAYLKASENIDY